MWVWGYEAAGAYLHVRKDEIRAAVYDGSLVAIQRPRGVLFNTDDLDALAYSWPHVEARVPTRSVVVGARKGGPGADALGDAAAGPQGRPRKRLYQEG